MRKTVENLVGRKFNGIEVIGYSHKVQYGVAKRYTHYWVCRCHCGKEFVCQSNIIQMEKQQSCGCKTKEIVGKKNSTHGMSNTKLYKTWRSMNNRCLPNGSYYALGRRVCPEWSFQDEHGFENFRDWSLANGYAENLSIDRIDNDGNYEPSNCRWADRYTQMNNTSLNVRYTYKGESKTLSQLAREYGVSRDRVKHRLQYGWDLDKAIKTPPMRTYYTYNGETHTLKEWADIIGIPKSTLKSRLYQGYSIEETLTGNMRIKKGVGIT